MTIGTIFRNDYVGNNSTGTYAYGFKIFLASDLRVKVRDAAGVETLLALTTHYTVTNVGNINGGNIVLVAGFAWMSGAVLLNGVTLAIRRVRALSQSSDFKNQAGYIPQNHEDAFDHEAMLVQQEQDEINRSIKIPETEPGGSGMTLPTKELRKNMFLMFDNDGNVSVGGTLTGISVGVAAGGIAFGTGTGLSQDVANLFWDDATNELKLGAGKITTGSSSVPLVLKGGTLGVFGRLDLSGHTWRAIPDSGNLNGEFQIWASGTAATSSLSFFDGAGATLGTFAATGKIFHTFADHEFRRLSDSSTQLLITGPASATRHHIATASNGGNPTFAPSAGVLALTSGVLIGTSISNSFQAKGLTINQDANDDEILSLKSSDVAHGITAAAETDTFAAFQKQGSLVGGVKIVGLSEDKIGVQIEGIQTVSDTTKTVGGIGAVRIQGKLKSGTGTVALGANANIVSVDDGSNTRFILDADGDSHQDVGTAWTNFDRLDDIATLDALACNVSRQDDPIRLTFERFLLDKRQELERHRLVTFNDDGHHFVNMSKLAMLHTGALRQLGARVAALENRLQLLN